MVLNFDLFGADGETEVVTGFGETVQSTLLYIIMLCGRTGVRSH